MKQIHKKFISLLLILAISDFLSPASALANTDSWPSAAPDFASQMIDGILKKFGAQEEAITEQTQKMNNMSKKLSAPEIFLTFEPKNPNPGEKITAIAEPMNFGNQGDSMYYTWFLKHKDENQDLDNDGEVTIEDHKIEAMRIIASDDFEGSEADDVDDDGYRAVMGGDDQRNVGEEPHCFFHDTESGNDYEFRECEDHLFPNAPGEETGDNSFGSVEENFWMTDPEDSDTADTGKTDEANVSGLGQKKFTWTYQSGDQVGVAIEGISFAPTDYDDASFKVMWALTKNKCELTDDALEEPGGGLGTGGYCPESCGSVTLDDHTFTPVAYGEYCALSTEHGLGADPYLETHCGDVMTAFDAKIGCIGREARCTDDDHTLILVMNGTHDDGTSDSLATVEPAQWPDCPDGCDFNRTVTKTGVSREKAPSSSYQIATTTTTTKKETVHLRNRTYSAGEMSEGTGGFAPAEEPIETYPTDEECWSVDEISADLGITDQSCCPEGNEYCSITAGPTFETSSSESSLEPGKTEEEGNLFQMTMEDFNECLMQNFVDPLEGGAFKKIGVSLSYDPQNPINDPDGNNSDKITISSTISDAKDAEFLYYKWEVFSGESTAGPWGEALPREALDGVGEMMGLGVKNLGFNLKFPDPTPPYLKVKLTVSENAYNGERKGHSDVIISLSNNQNSLRVFEANVSDSLDLSQGEQKCLLEGQTINDPICEVAKNQILEIGVNDPNMQAPLWNFRWHIGGEIFTYKYNDDGAASNPAYFPVTKDVGEQFAVSLSALNRETGEKVNLTQAFKVVDPKITITSQNEDSAVPKLLGFYTDTDNVAWPDYSDTEFETLEGSDIILQAKFTANTPPDDKIEWFVDGATYGTDDTLTFPAVKPVGSSYSVIASSLYTQDNKTAKALFDYWGISYDGLYEKMLTGDITINTVGSIADEETAARNVKKFLASLVSGFPVYLSFLFRIILTTGLLLFSFRVIFVLLPKARKEEI